MVWETDFLKQAVNVDRIKEYDPELRDIIAFNPPHNKRTMEEEGISFTEDYLYDITREPVYTDRSGWRGYYKIYSKYFKDIRYKKLNILEIGTEAGYGALALARYFPNSNITTVERLSSHVQEDIIRQKYFEYTKNVNFIYPFNSHNQEDWEKHFKDIKFDIIIDDGDHRIRGQYRTLINGYTYLNSKGYYFIEDIKTDTHVYNTYYHIDRLFRKLIEKNVSSLEVFYHINEEKLNYLLSSLKDRIDSLRSRGYSEEAVNQKLDNETYKAENYIVCIIK